MAYSARANSMFSGSSAAPSLRQPSSHNAQQSSALASRIASKKSELDSLKQLRAMSSALAMQMQALEDKLGTLKDGTEAIACVLANWHSVLQAINMASTKASAVHQGAVPRSDTDIQSGVPAMPSILVRIPADQSDDARD
ncbi:DASH complex subunit dad2 [Aspergillus melleus]|uniref:DASH complex subunit dad2 n=1 Tax=Aspergillus melleus TaxID=138277 RepID=A0ACC3B8Q1_9EURO|nr:DASH complex subunit dad2 [Aspergillus melleus]